MSNQDSTPSYDEAVQELQTIMNRMQAGDMGIDELAGSVRRASELLAFCQNRLQQTEAEVQAALERLGLEEDAG